MAACGHVSASSFQFEAVLKFYNIQAYSAELEFSTAREN